MTAALVAYHGQQAIKDEYLERVRVHQELDEIRRGVYYEVGGGQRPRMCAVGCTIHGSDHGRYERELGIPAALAKLEDAVFEGLPPAEAMGFPFAFLAAIRPGADLSLVDLRMRLLVLTDDGIGLQRTAASAGLAGIDRATGLIRRELDGDGPTGEEWAATGEVAWAALTAARAAWAVATGASAVGPAAFGAAWASTWAATTGATAGVAAFAAARAAAGGATWDAAWRRIAELLLAELAAAPMAAEDTTTTRGDDL